MPTKVSGSEPNIVRYQTRETEFEYARFWDSRSYEDSAERVLLDSWLKLYPKTAKWLVDIGGSFGRLLPTYVKRFNSVAILDYATNEFHLAKEAASSSGVVVEFVAANAYHLPLADSSQPALVAVRLVHHLEEPDRFFAEVNRVLAPGGVAIIEVSNKNHLKLLVRSILKLNFSDWRATHRDIGVSGVQADQSFTLIRAYRPSHIEQLIRTAGLKIVKRRSVSWLRRTPLAKLPQSMARFIEQLGQLISPLFMLAPSNWYVLRKRAGPARKIGHAFTSALINPSDGQCLNEKNIGSFRHQTQHGADYLDLRYPPFS